MSRIGETRGFRGPRSSGYVKCSGDLRKLEDRRRTQILCTNVGTNAVNWAVQVFDGSAPGDLRCETTTAQSIVVGEIEAFTTDSFADDFGLLGTCPDGDAGINVAVARVIADQKKAALMCTARVIDDATRNVVADLPVTPVGKPPKIKIK